MTITQITMVHLHLLTLDTYGIIPLMPPTQKDPFLIDSHKMQYHMERTLSWARASSIEEKLSIYPVYVEISPVGHCNHRCSFCAVDYIGYKNRSIPTDVLMRCLRRMADLGVKSVMFAGEGEPMLHPNISDITRYASEAGLDVAFTTNGTAMTKQFVGQALESVKWIKVSINGGSESYGLVHGCKQEQYERVWSNITYACGSAHQHTAIGVQCVVLPDNLRDIPGIVRRAKESGCKYIVLKPYSQHKKSITHTYEKVSYQDQEIRQVIEEAQRQATEDFQVIARLNAMEDWDDATHKYDKCRATPYFWAYIMATGDVYGCSAYLLDDRFCYGNILTQDFQQIWTSQKRRDNIEFVENKLDISQCRLNCRMNQVNKYLDDVAHPNPHANFI